MGRFSLASSLWFVAFIALGFAAVREASDFWLGATFVVTLGLLCASMLGAVLERSRGGAWWLGFALFGWAYFVAGLIPPLANPARVPSSWVAKRVFAVTNPIPPAVPRGRGRPETPQAYDARMSYQARASHVGPIGHWLFVLLFARAGATVSCVFTKGLPWRKQPTSDPAPIPTPAP